MNKLEKYIETNYLSGIATKSDYWFFVQTKPENKTFKLGKTIEKSLTKLKKLFPKENEALYREIKHLRKGDLINCPEPTLFFEDNEEVLIGNLKNCVVIKKIYDGKLYITEHDNGERYGKKIEGRYQKITHWYSIDKIESLNSEPLFKKDDLRLNYSQMQLSSLLTNVFYFGTDFNPDYQRGNVWDLEDKIKLLDSIFNNYDIGKFCFNHLGYSGDNTYEIVDGKQRLTTIVDFVTNKFQYEGKYWYELHPSDKNKFENKSVNVCQISETDKKTIYKYFLKMNVGGRPQEKSHIEYVENLLKEI